MGGKTLVIGTALAVLLVYSVGPAQSAGFNGVEHQSAGDQAWDSVYPEIREALRKVSNSEFILAFKECQGFPTLPSALIRYLLWR